MIKMYDVNNSDLTDTYVASLSSEFYFRKNDKLTNIVIHAYLDMTEKKCNSLTSIDMFSCLGGLLVTHRIAVRDVPGSISVSDKE